MPGFPWLEQTALTPEAIQPHMRALTKVGVPYTEAEIAQAPEQLKGKTEMDALIAYLQVLGTSVK